MHIFYRQGQTFMVDCADISKYTLSRLKGNCIQQASLIYGKALVTISSQSVHFYKLQGLDSGDN